MKEDVGYTEWELAAAAWRKAQQLEKPKTTNSERRLTHHRHDDKQHRRSRSRERDRGDDRVKRDREHRRSRNNDRHSRRSKSPRKSRERRRDQSRSRSRSRSRRRHHRTDELKDNDRRHRSHRQISQSSSSVLPSGIADMGQVDEFGRLIPPGKPYPSARSHVLSSSPVHVRRSSSSSRSISHRHDRPRRSRSRSRSRYRSTSPRRDEKWTHDKFALVADAPR